MEMEILKKGKRDRLRGICVSEISTIANFIDEKFCHIAKNGWDGLMREGNRVANYVDDFENFQFLYFVSQRPRPSLLQKQNRESTTREINGSFLLLFYDLLI